MRQDQTHVSFSFHLDCLLSKSRDAGHTKVHPIFSTRTEPWQSYQNYIFFIRANFLFAVPLWHIEASWNYPSGSIKISLICRKIALTCWKIAHQASVICCIMYPSLDKFYVILTFAVIVISELLMTLQNHQLGHQQEWGWLLFFTRIICISVMHNALTQLPRQKDFRWSCL